MDHTTTVDAVRTAAEIEAVLVRHGAKSIMRTYDNGSISGMSFLVDTGKRQIPIKLPVRTESVLAILQKEKRENPGKRIVATKEQAEKVVWRILKDWVEAQMALIDIHMVQMEEIFYRTSSFPAEIQYTRNWNSSSSCWRGKVLYQGRIAALFFCEGFLFLRSKNNFKFFESLAPHSRDFYRRHPFGKS